MYCNEIKHLVSQQLNSVQVNDLEKEQDYIDLINSILKTRGRLFVEQKFHQITSCINSITKKNTSPITLYERIFPELAPIMKNIDSVFENANANNELFQPLFHPSESLYKQWINDFKSCPLVENIDSQKFKINYSNCVDTLRLLKSWTINYPLVKGSSLIASNIKWDLGELPLDRPIHYNPKNSSIKSDLFTQLEKSEIIQIVSTKEPGKKIEISKENDSIILIRKNRFPVNPMGLKDWLSHFGINVSTCTTTFLIEFGMPYCGRFIGLDEILRHEGNGWGIIGRLGSSLSLAITFSENGQKEINMTMHPLWQSVVLALARLEYYVNPIYT